MCAQLTRLAFIGDVMLGRQVNERLRRELPAYPWGNTLSILRNCDWRCLNLECVISDVDRGVPQRLVKWLRFRSDATNIAVLRAAGIDAVSLANNHVLDGGDRALCDMLNALSAAAICHAGAGADLEGASKAAFSIVNGLRIALISFTDNVPEWEASADKPGVLYVRIEPADPRRSRLLEVIDRTRQDADLIVVAAHWGSNWGDAVPVEHVKLAHAMIEAGADVIFGHSAHVCRGFEIYKERPILYSTGSFIDDYAVSPVDRNDRSCVFIVDLEGCVVRRVRAIPTVVRDCQARLADDLEARVFSRNMITQCASLGTSAGLAATPTPIVETRVGEALLA